MSSGKLFTFFKFNNEICKINTLRVPSSLSCSGIGIPDYTFDKFIHVEAPLSQNIKASAFEETAFKTIELGNSSIKSSAVEATAIKSSAVEATAIKSSAVGASAVEATASAVEATAIEATAIEATAVEVTAVEATASTVIKKYKKKKITPTIKKHIWNTYIGYDILKHKCFCCKKATIQINEFEAGHVLSEADGGSCEISNFRPICRNCNLSMGSMHMEDYIKKYGLYI